MLDLLPAPALCAALGARLRVLRLGANFTQAELAQRAGCSLSALRRLESAGQGSLELLVRVAQALNAADGLNTLFRLSPVASIAQAEALSQAAPRQRARRSRKATA